MKREPAFTSDYAHILAKEPVGYHMDELVPKVCCDCDAEFEGTRLAIRCPACRPAARVARNARLHAKYRAKREKQ